MAMPHPRRLLALLGGALDQTGNLAAAASPATRSASPTLDRSPFLLTFDRSPRHPRVDTREEAPASGRRAKEREWARHNRTSCRGRWSY